MPDWLRNEDWGTWLAHAVLAVGVLVAFRLVGVPVWIAAALAWWGYVWREISSVFHAWLDSRPINWVDATMDVIAPGVAVLLAVWGLG